MIGEIQRPQKGEYQFRYLIRGERFPEWFLQIPGMRDIRRTYGTRETLAYIIYRIVPEEGSWAAGALMGCHGLEVYDAWAILESLIAQHMRYGLDAQPFCDSHQIFYFYPEIPADAHRYD